MKNEYKEKMVAPWYSSYTDNAFGELFYALTRIYQPKKVVELGVKAGYSTYYIAKALKENGAGSVDGYDLWEKYQFTSVKKAVAERNLKKYKEIVSLKLADVFGIEKKYKSVDILHVDLGNHGEMMEQIIPQWMDKVRQLIIIEGGSPERDQVGWIKKYNKQPLGPWLEQLKKNYKDIEVFTIDKFPSVTLIRKK